MERRIKFRKWPCVVQFGWYGNGRIAITLAHAVDGSAVAKATVNIPDEPLGDGEVFVKNWNENDGMMAALERAGIARDTGRRVPAGFCEAIVAKLLIEVPQ